MGMGLAIARLGDTVILLFSACIKGRCQVFSLYRVFENCFLSACKEEKSGVVFARA